MFIDFHQRVKAIKRGKKLNLKKKILEKVEKYIGKQNL